MLSISFNDTHRENCVLPNSVPEFIEIEARLLLSFIICSHNQQEFQGLQALAFLIYLKETSTPVFSCEYCEIF